eukprot:CAMPEP_0177665892 /NCGR_PEP_ID=MMETSP0447-20121125/21294_1 /TAXON_ID=0 /ORGANISM="Stygamoeba regulata, Strain BSH-02190019" /LENGTH=695 /DNA_ID=CAMNT_0019172011 /DNA_START=190 /DNA_END=2277 /DNA_ORIENTATION=-
MSSASGVLCASTNASVTTTLPRASQRSTHLPFKSKSSSNVREGLVAVDEQEDFDDDEDYSTTAGPQHRRVSSSTSASSPSGLRRDRESSGERSAVRLSKSSGGMTGPTTPGGRGKGGLQQRAKRHQRHQSSGARVNSTRRRSGGSGALKVNTPGCIYLQDEWTFWYDERPPKGMAAKDYASSIKVIGTFATVQNFWRYWNTMESHKLPNYSNLRLFKKGVKPMWEDEQNVNGGKWVINSPKNISHKFWGQLVLNVIGHNFVHSNDINGVVLSIRPTADLVSLWSAHANDDLIEITAEQLRKQLQLPSDLSISYRLHRGTMHQNSQRHHRHRSAGGLPSLTGGLPSLTGGQLSGNSSHRRQSSGGASFGSGSAGSAHMLNVPNSAPVPRHNAHRKSSSFSGGGADGGAGGCNLNSGHRRNAHLVERRLSSSHGGSLAGGSASSAGGKKTHSGQRLSAPAHARGGSSSAHRRTSSPTYEPGTPYLLPSHSGAGVSASSSSSKLAAARRGKQQQQGGAQARGVNAKGRGARSGARSREAGSGSHARGGAEQARFAHAGTEAPAAVSSFLSKLSLSTVLLCLALVTAVGVTVVVLQADTIAELLLPYLDPSVSLPKDASYYSAAAAAAGGLSEPLPPPDQQEHDSGEHSSGDGDPDLDGCYTLAPELDLELDLDLELELSTDEAVLDQDHAARTPGVVF